MKRKLSAILLSALLLVGCGSGTQPGGQTTDGTAGDSPSTAAPIDGAGQFSDRDLSGDYDTSAAIEIVLSGSTATCGANTVKCETGTVTILAEGTYLLSGSYTGMIVVDAEKTDKIQLVLDGVSVTSASSAALYVRQADKVFVTLAEGSENTLANGGSFVAIDENNIDAALFSKDDLTLNGSGMLTVTSPAGHGIVAKDDLVVAGGSYVVTAASHGLSANDSVRLSGAALTISAGKDGIKAENDEDSTLGYIYIESGALTVVSDGDGISAGAGLQIVDGAFNLTTGGGHGTVTQSDSGDWGWNFGGRGGMPGDWGGSSSGSDSTDTSAKGIKAAGDLLIAGGTFFIDAADDALHANANLTVSGGTLTLASGDDGIHADAATVIAGGSIDITDSYEGIEGLSITVSGGETKLVASDDGLNAAGGADQSGFGGFFGGGRGGRPGDLGQTGGDSFSDAEEDEMFIRISGGKLTVDAGGDGVDSNGSLTVSGGETYVAGPTNGGNGPLDYTTSAKVSGGIFIAVGSSQMAQNFSAAENQGAIMVGASGQSGSEIVLTDKSGSVLFSWTSPKSYSSVVLTCPGLAEGETYTLTVGGKATEVTLSSLIYGSSSGMGGMGGMGGGRPR